MWIRQLYFILSSINNDDKLYTDLFTDMLECTLPTYIDNRWDTLVGLKLTTHVIIPDLISDIAIVIMQMLIMLFIQSILSLHHQLVDLILDIVTQLKAIVISSITWSPQSMQSIHYVRM